MRQFIFGTIRPISFLAWIPPIIGAWLAGEKFGHGQIAACVGAIVSVAFANAFNNLIDKPVDKYNLAKLTLAKTRPVTAYYVVLFILPLEAWCLRQMPYRHLLLAVLFYLAYWHSYVIGRIPIVKRLFVSTLITLTTILATSVINVRMWLWMICVDGYFFCRETRKDRKDMKEDREYKFFRTGAQLDYWCVTAPFVAVAMLMISLFVLNRTAHLSWLVMSLGLTIAVWSYVQIRYSYGDYRMRLRHKKMAGRMGIVIALVALLPSFTPTMLSLVILVISCSILYRSFLPKWTRFRTSSMIHDACLWASIPVLAMLMVAQYSSILVGFSVSILIGVAVWEYCRLSKIQAALQPA